MIRSLFLLVAALALLAPTGLAAQAVVVNGRVVDDAGDPMPGAEVVLHSVTTGRGGDVLDRATADSAGGFSFTVMPVPDAIVFAAIRRGDTLYVGPPVRPEEAPDEYILVVSEETGIPFGTASPAAGTVGRPPGFDPPPPPRAAAGRGVWPWLFALLLGVGGWLGYRRYVTRRDPADERRWLLVEIAELDERCADRDDLEPGTRAEYLRRRALLERRLSEDAPVG
jgi:hypothetical protein